MKFKYKSILKSITATAVALPTFTVLSKEEEFRVGPLLGPKEDDVNVAIVGFGKEGKILTQACLQIPGVRFKAVCDIWHRQTKMAKGRLKYYGHFLNHYVDYREMLDAEGDKIDCVIIATPDWMHAEIACACMEAGKHVYCEKEMSNTLEKAREMVLCQRRTGKLLQIGHQRRSNPRYVHAIENVIRKHRVLGRVTHAYAQWNRAAALFETIKKEKAHVPELTLHKYGYENMEQFLNWRWFKKYGGGPMVDLGSHQIDLFFWAWDCCPISVTALGGADYYKRELNDNVMALYQFKTKEGQINRAFYQVQTTSSRGGFYEQFMGENGSMTISEISSRGNAVQREFRNDLHNTRLWNMFADQGLIKMPRNPRRSSLAAYGIALDVNVSAESLKSLLPVDLLKPAHMPHLENFFNAVRKGTPLSCPAELAYESAVAVLSTNRAVAERKTIHFKPEDFRV